MDKWPADRVERWPLARLTPFARNARTHSEEQIEQICASMREWGWTNPVLVAEDGTIIAGHGRVSAAQRLGFLEAPVMVATGWTEAQRRAYALADNKLALNAGWDLEILSAELGELKELGVDGGLMGFRDGELDQLMGKETGNTDPDDAPPAPADAVTRTGDLWVLGKHRILCGDSTREEPVRRLMGADRAQVVFTDPPYGVEYKGQGGSSTIAGDISQVAIPLSFKQAIQFATDDNARLYFCGGSSNVSMYYALFDSYLRSMPGLIIWDKGSIVMRRNNYHSQFEVIFYGWKGAGGANDFWYGGRKQDEASDIWAIKRDNGKDYLHPTQKPTALAERAISNSCPPSGIVYEPFSGSGSTLIACERTRRTCRALELDPVYVDVAVKRWQDFTGQTATLEGSGASFAEIANLRGIHARSETKAHVAEAG